MEISWNLMESHGILWNLGVLVNNVRRFIECELKRQTKLIKLNP